MEEYITSIFTVEEQVKLGSPPASPGFLLCLLFDGIPPKRLYLFKSQIQINSHLTNIQTAEVVKFVICNL
jgi:hypothetical protein